MKRVFVNMPRKGKTKEQFENGKEFFSSFIVADTARKYLFNNEDVELVSFDIPFDQWKEIPIIGQRVECSSKLKNIDYMVLCGNYSKSKECMLWKEIAESYYGIPLLTLRNINGMFTLQPLKFDK